MSNSKQFPERRPGRPVRRDLGGYTTAPINLPWRDGVVAVLERFGFSRGIDNSEDAAGQSPTCEEIIGEIHDALSFRAHQPSGVLHEADEAEDLAELHVRLEDVIDSLDAMANNTRLRILDARSPVDPLDLTEPLAGMLVAVGRARRDLGPISSRRGRVPYDDARETPLLAALVTIWFGEFRSDPGIDRHGGYAEAGRREYEGRLLDFLEQMFNALDIDAGSRSTIGAHVLQKTEKNGRPIPSMQERIKARFQGGAKIPPKNA